MRQNLFIYFFMDTFTTVTQSSDQGRRVQKVKTPNELKINQMITFFCFLGCFDWIQRVFFKAPPV